MGKADDAAQCFADGFNCAQAVLSSFSEDLGLPREMAYKVAGAFGSGMGQLGETCGAVTGALMLLGLKYGKCKATDTVSKDRTYAFVKAYTDSFTKKFGSIKCRDLIGFDLSDGTQLQEARNSGVFQKMCPGYITHSVELIEDIFSKNR